MASEVPATSESVPSRRPVTGSCLCGNIKYVAYLTLPHGRPTKLANSMQISYRCNCTVCHKTGFMHIRVASSPDDFALLAPLDPLQDLGDFMCATKEFHLLFCRTCGVQCFRFAGKGEVVEGVLPGVGEDGAKTKYWHPVKEGWAEGRENGCYLTINAVTLDAGQEGVDLRAWTENKAVLYLNNLSPELADLPIKPNSWEKPFEGGCY
ncbi:hypothetical protein GQ53DRAFT_855504 [Thozetella sp. PMI_491]|nr:hypothetical protein GQ53DRAFT_855504 [Thozetella sp. PMI_491]